MDTKLAHDPSFGVSDRKSFLRVIAYDKLNLWYSPQVNKLNIDGLSTTKHLACNWLSYYFTK